MALSMFRDQDFMTSEFEALGYYSMPDFMALGRAYGVDEKAVVGIIGEYRDRMPQVEDMVNHSLFRNMRKRNISAYSAIAWPCSVIQSEMGKCSCRYHSISKLARENF